MTAWWLSDDCLMLFWWLPNYWLRAANFPMPVQWLHDPKHLNQLSPESKVLKGIQILLSGESWRVDLGSRAAAGTAAAAPPPPRRHRRRHRRQCALLQLVWVPSLCTALQCRRIAENLRSFCRGSCVHYTNTTGIFRYVPCLGCLVQLVLTAYLKTRPSMHWPMIIRQYI